MTAAQVRVDPADNIWAVDEMSNMVMKFDPEGRVAMLLGRKAESEFIPPRAPAGDGAGQPTDLFNRPTDVAWDAAGNIFVADGAGNARVAKFDKDGKFLKSWGKRGAGPGEFANVLSIAVDAQGNVYTGDGGNKRIQVFDNNGVFKTSFSNFGNAQAMCITKGASPFLYVSNSNPWNDIDVAGEIYRMRLDGTVLGKFGRAGRLLKEFGAVNSIDCPTDNPSKALPTGAMTEILPSDGSASWGYTIVTIRNSPVVPSAKATREFMVTTSGGTARNGTISALSSSGAKFAVSLRLPRRAKSRSVMIIESCSFTCAS